MALSLFSPAGDVLALCLLVRLTLPAGSIGWSVLCALGASPGAVSQAVTRLLLADQQAMSVHACSPSAHGKMAFALEGASIRCSTVMEAVRSSRSLHGQSETQVRSQQPELVMKVHMLHAGALHVYVSHTLRGRLCVGPAAWNAALTLVQSSWQAALDTATLACGATQILSDDTLSEFWCKALTPQRHDLRHDSVCSAMHEKRSISAVCCQQLMTCFKSLPRLIHGRRTSYGCVLASSSKNAAVPGHATYTISRG